MPDVFDRLLFVTERMPGMDWPLIRSRLLVTCLMICATLSACTKDPAQLIASAQQRAAKADHAGAILDLKSALQVEPNNGAARFLLGQFHNEVFDHPSAEKELMRARELGVVEGGRVAVELARALRAQGKFKELVKIVEVSAVYEPQNLATIHALRGRAYHALGEQADTELSLEKARAAAPENFDVALLQSQISAGKGDLDGALKTVDELLSRAPKHFDAWTYKAELLRAKGKNSDALAAYDEVLKLHPTHLRALLSRTAILLSLGRLDDAQKDVNTLRKRYGVQPVVMVQQGAIHLARGKPQEALESAQIALKNAPDLATANLLAGASHFALGSPRHAEQILSKFIAANPRDIFARRILAQAVLALGEPQRALDVIEPVLRRKTQDARFYAIAGDAYLQLGENAKALSWLEKAASASPDDNEISVQHALTQIAWGQAESGIAALESAVSTLQRASRADEMLVLMHLSKRSYARAKELVEEMKRRPNAGPIVNNLEGLVLVGQGDRESASKAFSAALTQQPTFLPALRNLVQLDVAAGKVEQAVKRYQAVLAANPKNVETLLAFADFEQQLGRTKEALALLERAVATSPGSAEPRIRLVPLYLRAGDNQRAVTAAEEGLSANPDDPRLIELAAVAMLASGKENTALQTIARLTRLSPKSEYTHLQVAKVQNAAKHIKDAEGSLRRALEINPRFLDAQIAFGQLLVAGKRYDEALTFARQIQKAEPKAPIGYLLEGEVLELTKQFPGALTAYRKALAIRPAGEFAVKLFVARGRAGDLTGAIAELKQWVGQHPQQVLAREKLGDSFLSMGDYQGAVTQYELIVKSGQVSIDTINKLAWAYHKLDNPRALELAERAYQLAPNFAATGDTYGWLLLKKGEAKRAKEILEKAAKSAPEEPLIQYHLAEAVAKAGDRNEARALVKKLLDSGRPFAERPEAEKLLAALSR